MTLGTLTAGIAALSVAGLACMWLVMRIVPRAGTWNQPAAAFRAPGRMVQLAMYLLALAHVLAGAIVASRLPGGFEPGVAVVGVVVAGFYVACAHVSLIARRPRSAAGTP